MMRLFLSSVVCGGLVGGIVLGYSTTRPVIAAFDSSETVSKDSKIMHAAIRMRGTLQALSPDGYAIFETKDTLSSTHTITFLGKIDNVAQIPLLHVGDRVSAEIARSPGLIHFTSMVVLLSRNSSI